MEWHMIHFEFNFIKMIQKSFEFWLTFSGVLVWILFNITKNKGTITETLKFKMQIQTIVSSIEKLFQ